MRGVSRSDAFAPMSCSSGSNPAVIEIEHRYIAHTVPKIRSMGKIGID